MTRAGDQAPELLQRLGKPHEGWSCRRRSGFSEGLFCIQGYQKRSQAKGLFRLPDCAQWSDHLKYRSLCGMIC